MRRPGWRSDRGITDRLDRRSGCGTRNLGGIACNRCPRLSTGDFGCITCNWCSRLTDCGSRLRARGWIGDRLPDFCLLVGTSDSRFRTRTCRQSRAGRDSLDGTHPGGLRPGFSVGHVVWACVRIRILGAQSGRRLVFLRRSQRPITAENQVTVGALRLRCIA